MEIGKIYLFGDKHTFKITPTKITQKFITFDLIEKFGGGNFVSYQNVKRKIHIEKNKTYINCNVYFKLQNNFLYLEEAKLLT